MKKTTSILSLVLLLSSYSFADFIRAEAGTGVWSAKASGDARYKGSTNFSLEDNYGLDKSDSSTYFYGFVKHPLPLIPNLRVELTNFETKGSVENSVEFNSNTYNSSEDVTLNLDQSDVAFYYNILDDTAWMTLDLGVNFKTFNGSMSVDNQKTSISATIPMFYARGRVSIPATDLAVEVDSKYISISGSTLSDMRIKADYNVFTSPLISVGIEGGYRTQNLTLDISDVDLKSDITVDGMFLGINGKF